MYKIKMLSLQVMKCQNKREKWVEEKRFLLKEKNVKPERWKEHTEEEEARVCEMMVKVIPLSSLFHTQQLSLSLSANIFSLSLSLSDLCDQNKR